MPAGLFASCQGIQPITILLFSSPRRPPPLQKLHAWCMPRMLPVIVVWRAIFL